MVLNKETENNFQDFLLGESNTCERRSRTRTLHSVSHTGQERTKRISVKYLLETLLATGKEDNFARNLLWSLGSISYHGSEYVTVHEKEIGS